LGLVGAQIRQTDGVNATAGDAAASSTKAKRSCSTAGARWPFLRKAPPTKDELRVQAMADVDELNSSFRLIQLNPGSLVFDSVRSAFTDASKFKPVLPQAAAGQKGLKPTAGDSP
jgi:hypothetical protein